MSAYHLAWHAILACCLYLHLTFLLALSGQAIGSNISNSTLDAVLQMGNAMVSLRRLTQYLILEERSDEVQQLPRVGVDISGGNFYWSEPPKTKKLDGVKGAPGQGKKRSLLSIFGGLKLRKGPAVGTGPAKDSDKPSGTDAQTDKAAGAATADPEEVAVTLGSTQDASKLGTKVAPGEASSSSSSSSDSQAEPLYNNNGKGASQTPSEDSFPDAVKPVTAANDASSGQVSNVTHCSLSSAVD